MNSELLKPNLSTSFRDTELQEKIEQLRSRRLEIPEIDRALYEEMKRRYMYSEENPMEESAMPLGSGYVNLEEKVKALQSQVDCLETENERLRQENAMLEKRMIESNEKANTLKEQFENLKSEYDRMHIELRGVMAENKVYRLMPEGVLGWLKKC